MRRNVTLVSIVVALASDGSMLEACDSRSPTVSANQPLSASAFAAAVGVVLRDQASSTKTVLPFYLAIARMNGADSTQVIRRDAPHDDSVVSALLARPEFSGSCEPRLQGSDAPICELAAGQEAAYLVTISAPRQLTADTVEIDLTFEGVRSPGAHPLPSVGHGMRYRVVGRDSAWTVVARTQTFIT